MIDIFNLEQITAPAIGVNSMVAGYCENTRVDTPPVAGAYAKELMNIAKKDDI